ncbi:MAG: helix-turn-helix domain-containing protein, partial [Solirubrobacteraceae bacterium]
MQSALIDRVQALRAADYTPKEIAAALGIDKATATRLVRAAA